MLSRIDGRLELAVAAITDRWSDVVPAVDERDRLIVLARVVKAERRDEWKGIKLQDVLIAARVAFAPDQLRQAALTSFRHFLVEQAEISCESSLVRAMFRAYLESYSPGAAHTEALSRSIAKNVGQLSLAERVTLDELPQLLDGARAPELIAHFLREDSDPGAALLNLGLRDIYSGGLMYHVHIAMIGCYSSLLAAGEAATLRRLLKWLQPKGMQARNIGAGVAMDAALSPWLKATPSTKYQSLLIRGFVDVYGDPRLSNGKAWNEASDETRSLMVRWLTGSTMTIFLDAISRSNDENMWETRKQFWMQMYEAEHIDEAWVAFSEAAHDTARSMATTDEEQSLYAGFGRQCAGGSRINTSLLIMRVGRRIIVEGSHNYKVQVFEHGNPQQPAMYQKSYDCEQIRKESDDQKAHSFGNNWKEWVREKVL